jgi:hypothetical protein
MVLAETRGPGKDGSELLWNQNLGHFTVCIHLRTFDVSWEAFSFFLHSLVKLSNSLSSRLDPRFEFQLSHDQPHDLGPCHHL